MQKKNNFPMVVVIIGVFIVFLIILFSTFGRSGKGGQSGVLQQQTAVQRLADESGQPVDYSIENGVIRHLSFKWSGQTGQSSQAVLSDFLVEFADLFNIENIEQQLQLIDTIQSDFGNNTYRYRQVYNGVPIYGSDLVFYVDQYGILNGYEGGYSAGLSINTQPSISESDAVDAVEKYTSSNTLELIQPGSLVIYDPAVFGGTDIDQSRLAWKIDLASDEGSSENIYSTFLVDAHSGEMIFEIPILYTAKDFAIHDAENKKRWDLARIFLGKLVAPKQVMDEDGLLDEDETVDEEAQNVWQHMHTIYDFYNSNFGWKSYDGEDSQITAYINFEFNGMSNIQCKNAAWDHKNEIMLYCDDTTDSVDVFAHEFTHGVSGALVDFSVESGKVSESNALNESYSDIFTAFIDEEHPWQICFSDCAGGDLVRDLSDPHNHPKREFPETYDELSEPGEESCEGDEKNGCGHVNSTIHSHAVYLFTSSIGVEKAQNIMFYSLKDGYMPSNANFKTARRVITNTCQRLIGEFGITSQDCAVVEDAYESVGILDETKSVEPQQEEQPDSVITVIAPIPQTTAVPQTTSLDSETVLVMDISGSMNEYDISGVTKIEAAQHASSSLLDVIKTEQEAYSGSISHSIGLVSFSYTSYTESQLTSSIDDVQNMIWNLYPDGQTAMADGLQAGIDLFDENNTSKQIIVLLSDGLPNASSTGWFWTQEEYKDEVIELSSQAGERGICVYTIGFGDPSADEDSDKYIDEGFLRDIASASKCGDYYNAQDAGQLADVFVELRHASMGSILFEKSGTINQGENLDLGSFSVPGGQSQMLFTLNWPGSQLTAALVDPGGKTVDSGYPGATISSQDTITSVVIESPQGGDWHLQIYGQDVPEGVISYNTVVSTRSAGKGKSTSSWLWVVLGGVVVVIALAASRKPGQVAAAGARQAQGPRLVFTNGSLAGKQLKLSTDMLIGRSEKCQIQIPDPSVSRKHARIVYANERWFIQDQNSSSGIYVNGKKEQSIRLHSGDVIRLGNTEIKFYSR